MQMHSPDDQISNMTTEKETIQSTQPFDLLLDPRRVTISVSQAADVLGIAKSTAHNAYKETGVLMEGVPVLQVGKRRVVSVTLLRAALGYAEPER
jgi:hypothetical protein